MKNFIVYSKLQELKEYVSDKELYLLIDKYKYNESDIGEHLYYCDKCKKNKIISQMYIYNHNSVVSNKCLDCKDKIDAKNYILNVVSKSLPTPFKDIYNRFNNICYCFNKYRSGSSNETYNWYYRNYICSKCKNCIVDDSYSIKYYECTLEDELDELDYIHEKCPFKKRLEFILTLEDKKNNELNSNKRKTETLITKEHIDFKTALLRLNRKIKELNK